MNRIEKKINQSRSKVIQEWLINNSKDLTDKQKLRIYPTWIKVMEDKGENELAINLKKEIVAIKDKKPKILILFKKIKKAFQKLLKKGS